MDIKAQLKKLKLTKKSWSFLLGAATAAAILGFASKWWFGPDNIVEEKCEQFIEKTTGFDLDLSPRSPEYPMRYGAVRGDPEDV